MSVQTTLTFALMDPPFESSRVSTAMRLMYLAAERGCHLKVFAYEGAVLLPLATQKPHPNAVHGHDVEEEQHPMTKEWVEGLINLARDKGGSVEWANCGLCVDERGAEPPVEGVRRGTPADLVKFAEESNNTVVIATKS